jgi:hypothetical protein
MSSWAMRVGSGMKRFWRQQARVISTPHSRLTKAPAETKSGAWLGLVRTAAPTISPRSTSGVHAPNSRAGCSNLPTSLLLAQPMLGRSRTTPRCEAEAARMGVALAVEEHDVRLLSHLTKGVEDGRGLAKCQKARHVRKGHRSGRVPNFQDFQGMEVEHDHHRVGGRAALVPRVCVVDPGDAVNVFDPKPILEAQVDAEVLLYRASLGG